LAPSMSEVAPSTLKAAEEPSWWVEAIARDPGAGSKRHREPLSGSSDVLLGLGVLMGLDSEL